MRSALASATEAAAVTLLGLMAGFFFAFAADVAPAMAQLDASGYVTAQQWINRVVRNAVFGGVYFGSVLLPCVAAAAAAFEGPAPARPAVVRDCCGLLRRGVLGDTQRQRADQQRTGDLERGGTARFVGACTRPLERQQPHPRHRCCAVFRRVGAVAGLR